MAIFPGTAEIVRDGIDQNCNGFGLTIIITRAQYETKDSKLDVRAESLRNAQTNLRTESYGPVSWNGGKTYW